MTYVEVGRKELKTDYPHEKGLTSGTTKQTGRIMNLIAQGSLGIKTRVLSKDKKGL